MFCGSFIKVELSGPRVCSVCFMSENSFGGLRCENVEHYRRLSARDRRDQLAVRRAIPCGRRRSTIQFAVRGDQYGDAHHIWSRGSLGDLGSLGSAPARNKMGSRRGATCLKFAHTEAWREE